MISAKKVTVQGYPMDTYSMAFTPGSDADPTKTGRTNPGPVYYDRGTAGLLLQAAAYFDPNLKDESLSPKPITFDKDAMTPRGDSKVQTKYGKIPGELPS
jgi:hypothetical protein